MIEDGLYRVYRTRFDEAHQQHRRLIARLMVHQGDIWHLEDHDQIHELIPEGPISKSTENRFNQMKHSGYFQVVNEEDLHEGNHPEHIEEVDLGEATPEAKFIMTGDGLGKPSVVELWDHAVVVDGQKLDDADAQHLLHEVQAGRIVLSPLE